MITPLIAHDCAIALQEIIYYNSSHMASESRKPNSVKAQRHDRILQAAAALFAEKGYPEVSFEQIAEEAQVARRTLYNHFHDKCSLYQTLIEQIMITANTRILEFVELYGSSRDTAFKLCYDLWNEYGVTLKIIHHEGWETYPEMSDLHRQFLKVFLSLFIEPSSKGLSPEVQTRLVYNSFIGVLESLEPGEDQERQFMKIMKGMLV